jgi:hypothetical protein
MGLLYLYLLLLEESSCISSHSKIEEARYFSAFFNPAYYCAVSGSAGS